MKSKKPLLRLKDVWRTYYLGENVLHVLKNVNLEIDKGEFVVIIGPSGSGKSTLMNQVGILDIPSKGKIFLEGKDISTLDESSLAQLRGKKIGFVFQQFNLIPTLTALENVILPTIFQNIPEEKRIDQAKKLLSLVGLGERFNHKPNELSGGQQQRVAIVRALINQPRLILADEPTGNLDSKSGQEVMEVLQDLNEEGHTILMVTHEKYVAECARRIIILKDGQIISDQRVANQHAAKDGLEK